MTHQKTWLIITNFQWFRWVGDVKWINIQLKQQRALGVYDWLPGSWISSQTWLNLMFFCIVYTFLRNEMIKNIKTTSKYVLSVVHYYPLLFSVKLFAYGRIDCCLLAIVILPILKAYYSCSITPTHRSRYGQHVLCILFSSTVADQVIKYSINKYSSEYFPLSHPVMCILGSDYILKNFQNQLVFHLCCCVEQANKFVPLEGGKANHSQIYLLWQVVFVLLGWFHTEIEEETRTVYFFEMTCVTMHACMWVKQLGMKRIYKMQNTRICSMENVFEIWKF